MPKPDEKILLVDDEPRLLAGLRRRLSDRFHVLTAESADEGIAALETHGKIGAVLSDMKMPGRDGADFLGEAGRRWPEVRRLMLTGNTDQETAIRAVNAGRVFRFFRKPCDAESLAEALNEALEEYRFATRSVKEKHLLEIRALAGERARKSFLSMMSHELLTPLNHVLGFSSMLELKLKQQNEPEALEYLTYIKDAGETLVRMVHRVLEIARFTSNDLRRDHTEFEITEILKEEVDRIRDKADPRFISVSFQTSPRPIYIRASDYEFRSAISELLDNAVKFSHDGGHVGVAVNYIEGEATIRVADTGIGMAEETIERALGVFFQEEEDTTIRRFDGIGLGLTLVALFTNANGGRLAIESRRNCGTAIMMSLNAAMEPGVSMVDELCAKFA
jgi:signal transduction histidine kinase